MFSRISTSLLLLGHFAVASVAVAQRWVSPSRSTYADSCLPVSEFQLGGLALGADGEKALEDLGKWLRVKTGSGEDDGGRYELKTYYFRDLEIDIVRGLVDRVATHSPRTSTPSGLRPGLSREAVGRFLAARGVTFKQGADTLEIPPCQSTAPEGLVVEDLLELAFDHTGRVRAIWMAASRP
jgi:hypothetical protein